MLYFKKQHFPFLLALIFLFLASAYIVVVAWVEPTALPPIGNVDPPINTGGNPQEKASTFAATQFLDQQDLTGTYFLDIAGDALNRSAYFAGTVGVGISPSNTNGLSVLLAGAGKQNLLRLVNNQGPAANTGGRINFQGDVGLNSMVYLDAGWEGAANTNAYFSVYTRGSGLISEKFRITSDGNVGIGRVPNWPLHVAGSTAAAAWNDVIFSVENSGAGNGIFSINSTGGAGNANFFFEIDGNERGTFGYDRPGNFVAMSNIAYSPNFLGGLRLYSDGSLRFYDSATNQEIFRAERAGLGGNVGIGDTSPASLLTVGNGGRFRVNSSGDLIRINNIPYSWPAAQAVGNRCLANDGAGNLSWGACGGAAGAPLAASYLVLGLDGTLTNERLLTAGTGLSLNDGGANGNATLYVNPAQTQLRVSGTCAAGSSIRVINQNGTVTCETDDGGAGGGAPLAASYLVLGLDGTLTNERLLTAGTGLSLNDGGANGNATLYVNPAQTQLRVSGTCAAGSSIRVINQNGTVTCETDDGGAGGGAPLAASYLVLGLDGTLTNERLLTAGTGLSLNDGGANGNATLYVNPAQTQLRVSGTCAAGSSIRVINQNGTVTCETDDGGAGGGVTTVGSMTAATVFADVNADNDWLGLGAAAGRIEFDDNLMVLDEVNILSARVGISDNSPDALLDILQMGVNEPAFRVDDDFDGDATPFIIEADGDVGIGEDTPSAKLDVVGNVEITGQTTISSSLSAGSLSVGGNASINGTLNMNNNQIQNMRIENRTTNPGGPSVGRIWICTDNDGTPYDCIAN